MLTQPTEPRTQIKQIIPARPAGFWPREAVVTGWLIVLAGAVLRVRNWLHWRSLWLDEIYLAHSVVTRGFHRLLLSPLDYWQAAPAGFLVLERTCVDLFGSGERSLRLPSLLAGLAALPMFYGLARRILSLRAALLAILLFSCLVPLIYYAQEAKQYSTDVLSALAILMTAVSVDLHPKSRGRLVVYAIVGAISLFFSISSVMVLAGTAAVLAISRAARSKKLIAALPLAIVMGMWALLEVLNVRVFLLPLMRGPVHEGLYQYWVAAGGFPPLEPDQFMGWIWKSLRNLIGSYETMYISGSDLGILVALIGLMGMIWSRRGTAAMLLISPLPLALIAALARKYPFGDRLAVYLVPSIALLMAAGIDFLWGAEGGRRWMLGFLVAAMVIWGSVARSVYVFRFPAGREETRQAYEWIRRNWRAGDMLFLSHLSIPSFDYYAPKTGMAGLQQLWQAPADDPRGRPNLLEAGAQGIVAAPWFYKALAPPGPLQAPKGYVFGGLDHTSDPALYLDEIDGAFNSKPQWLWPPIRRVWVVFAHDWDEHLAKLCLPELDRRAQLMYRLPGVGVDVYLYELTGSPTAYQTP
ncbi:MAG TPA: glycosyltransferase family 39 protein [Tepidisphaeraceae bacterium]|nr:glycosyltransferase family 39 protein [Tepidisphaeraceae bacterium]